MTYNFDEECCRLGTSCTKWDRYKKRYGLEDVVALWVADMDFKTVPEVQKAIIARASHSIYGYTDADDEVYEEIIAWHKRHHEIELEKEDIILNTGVVYALYQLVELLVKKDEKVIVMPPVYPPLFNTPLHLKREVVYSSLINEDDIYSIDYEDFEEKLKNDDKIKCFILCNPHNPTGVCYSIEELNKLASICHKYDVKIISDEIHADLVMPHHKQYTALLIDEEYLNDVFVLCAPTKTFNLAGMKISYTLCKNKDLQKLLASEAKASGLSSINIFGFEAIKAAYHYGDEWLKECVEYIYENLKYVDTYLKENLPKAKYHIPEATYLAWVNLEAYDLPQDFNERLMMEGGVQFNPGESFDKAYKKYIRINCATTRSNLKKGLDRLCAWLKANKCL